MGCYQCGSSGEQPIRVKYTTGKREIVPLCENCLFDIQSGGFVDEAIPIDENESRR